jgi:dimethylargininase
VIDIRGIAGLLHLKSGMAAVGPETLVVAGALSAHPALAGYTLLQVEPEEAYAANCVRVNDRVLLAAGAPRLEGSLRSAGYSPLVLDVSEFRKMDGGLSCLSLRY